ncbi:MAG: GNAT family N-acetyltransferase [Nitrospinae bacterium]|nr:GNAT family N-acetyltransferase [Nitrospinota bacterium]
MPMTGLRHEKFLIRPFVPEDAPALARHAANRNVWQTLSDDFPHPYTEEQAANWIASAMNASPRTHFAIEVKGEAAGAIGYRVMPGGFNAEIGYWLGEDFWEQGIATAAVDLMLDHIFARHPVPSVTANVFEFNNASIRVLQKTGFRLIGWQTATKAGKTVQQIIYSRGRGAGGRA